MYIWRLFSAAAKRVWIFLACRQQPHSQPKDMNTNNIRKDFPILEQSVHGYPLTYLDNAATTQKPKQVLNTLMEFYNTINSNIHRGVHHLSQEATAAYEEARSYIASYMDADERYCVLFTRGTTESINLVASCFSSLLNTGDKVVTTVSDHHSSFVPWQQACLRKGAEFKVVSMLPDGNIDREQLHRLLNEEPKILILPHISNVIGKVNPVKEIIAEAHCRGTAVLVDGAQAIAHIPVSLAEIDADFYCWSGHKAYGPTGIGVLCAKKAWLDKLPPYQYGGEMIEDVSIERTTFASLPFKFEAGTPPFAEAIAMKTALQYIKGIGFAPLLQHEEALTCYAIEKLKAIKGMVIYGSEDHRAGVISFNIKGAYHYDVGVILDQMGVAVRTGHHCAQPLMRFLGIPGTVRCSFAMYNTEQDIDRLADAVEKAARMLT